MYPAQYFGLFPPFPRTKRCFVAMSFAPALEPRWQNVIAPAIRDAELDPYRVKDATISDSILTDILKNISEARLVFADISSIEKGVRNANVLYEVGLAHAVREPQEVVIFRSDEDKHLFDLANIRVNDFRPDTEPDKAKALITAALRDAIKEVDLTRHAVVTKAVEALDEPGFFVLSRGIESGGFEYPSLGNMGDIMTSLPYLLAINRLLEGGLLKTITRGTQPVGPTVGDLVREQVRYVVTPLGSIVVAKAMSRMAAGAGEILEALTRDESRDQSRTSGPE